MPLTLVFPKLITEQVLYETMATATEQPDLC